MATEVSILICAYNEEDHIAGLLVSLANQTDIKNVKEILLADNDSTDATIQKAVAIAMDYHLPITILSLKENNIGRARRLLVEKASSDWIVFVDADCRVQPNWLQSLRYNFLSCTKTNSSVVGVGGPNRMPAKNLFQKTINKNLQSSLLHGFSAQSYSTKGKAKVVDHLPTTNAMLLRSAVLNAGNFADRFSRFGEDLDLGLRISSSGGQLVMYDQPVVENNCAENLKDWLFRMWRFGNAQAMVFGRRGGFITGFLVLSSLVLMTLIFQPRFLFLTVVFYLVAVTFMARSPFPLGSRWPLGFAMALGVWSLTPISYFAGFLTSLVFRIFQWNPLNPIIFFRYLFESVDRAKTPFRPGSRHS